MQPLDEEYMVRREKQIRELYSLRASAWACLVFGLALLGLSVVLMVGGSGGLGVALFLIALAFEAGAAFIFADYYGKKAADRAIQEERERLLMLYSRADKPKRSAEEDAFRLADDGEMEEEAPVPLDTLTGRERG